MYKYDAYGYIKEITGKTALERDTIGKLQPLKYKGYINDKKQGIIICSQDIIHRF